MNLEHIRTNLEEAERLVRYRKLKEAETLVKEVLDSSIQKDYVLGNIRANILLGTIYNIKGRYSNDQSFYPIAIKYLKAASKINAQNQEFPAIKILLELGHIYLNQKKFTEAEKNFNKALQLSKSGFIEGQILGKVAMSQLYFHQNDFDHALKFILDAKEDITESPDEGLFLEIFSQLILVYLRRRQLSELSHLSSMVLETSQQIGDIEREILALNSTAIVHGARSEHKLAVEYFLEALNKSETIGYRQGIVYCLINTATIYANLFNHDEALERYERALKDFEDILDSNTQTIIINNIGNIYYELEQPLAAKEQFEKALKLTKSVSYVEMIPHILAQLSRAYVAIEDYERACHYAEEADKQIEKVGALAGRQINLINLGNIYHHRGNDSKAIEYIKKGIEASRSSNDDVSEIRGYGIIAKIYEKQEDFKKAYEYQVKYADAQKIFAKEQRIRQTIDLEIKYSLEEKEKAIALLTKQNQMQATIIEQSKKITEKNEELTQANEDLKQFAYVASHDLKEPLRMIGSYTKLLERQYRHELEGAEMYFKFIDDGVNRMKTLLDDLLRYATIGKTIDIEEVDMNEVLDNVTTNLTVAIQESNATVEVPTLPTILSNRSLLSQLLQNLISNALKFRNANRPPIVKIDIEENEENYIFSVKDNGIGIADEHQHRIFEIFQRLHKRTQYEGTGIGLSICQKIVNKLGGKIWLKSKITIGTTFFFTIPKR